MPNFQAYIGPSTTTMVFYKQAMNAGGATSVAVSDMGTGSDDNVLEMSISYTTAN